MQPDKKQAWEDWGVVGCPYGKARVSPGCSGLAYCSQPLLGLGSDVCSAAELLGLMDRSGLDCDFMRSVRQKRQNFWSARAQY